MRAFKILFLSLVAFCLLASCSESLNETSDAITDETSINEQLIKDGYTMKKIETESGYNLELEFAEKEYNENGQPFDNRFYTGTKTIEMDGSFKSKRAEVAYTKREGGTYIYSNNPEMLAPEDIGQAILRTKNLQGDVIFTYEHSNHTGVPVYFGYQLLNEGETDVTVTVTNLGFQPDGEWLGQRSWSDYFNYRFELPEDYFRPDGSVNPIYVGCDYIDYTPKFREPVSVTVPAGKYIYVLGGTSADAYNNTNIFNSADTPILPGKCSNAVVKFNVSGGAVTGTFYVYTEASQVQANPKEQGFITERFNSKTQKMTDYSKQYKGVDPTAGLIESNITFVVDDETKSGKLPITYTKYYDPAYATKNTPYAEYTLAPKVINATEWVTALNPNGVDKAMVRVDFNCGPDSPCNDENLRKAIAYAIDADACAYSIHGEFGHQVFECTNPNLKDSSEEVFRDDYYNYDPAKAKEFLDKSSYNGQTLKILVMPNKNVAPIATLVQQYLGALGINVELMQYEFAQFKPLKWETTGKEWDLELQGVSSSDLYQYQCVEELGPRDGVSGDNLLYFHDDELEKLFLATTKEDTYGPEATKALLDYNYEHCFVYGLYYGERLTFMRDYCQGEYCETMGGAIQYSPMYMAK